MHGGCDNESCRSVDSMPSGDAAVESTAAAAAGMPDIEDHFTWKALLSGIACFFCQIHIWPKYEIQKDNMVCWGMCCWSTFSIFFCLLRASTSEYVA